MQALVKIETKTGWKGTVTLTAPASHKRTMILMKCKVRELKDSKKIKALKNQKERDDAGERNIEIMAMVYDSVREFIDEVDLEGPNGAKCESVEEFEHAEGLEMAFLDIAAEFCEGFGPKKPKSP